MSRGYRATLPRYSLALYLMGHLLSRQEATIASQLAMAAGRRLEFIMKSLFDRIEGKKPEDLTTEVLAYILQKQPPDGLQSVFLDVPGYSPQAVTVYTQKWIDQYSRLDLLLTGRSSDLAIAIENKFNAAFTETNGKPQLFRYHKWLVEGSGFAETSLVVLTVGRRKNEIKQEVRDQLSMKSWKNGGRSSRGCTVRVMLWTDLLESLRHEAERNKDVESQFLITYLEQFIDNRYLHTVEFTPEDTDIMSDGLIGGRLAKIYDAIDDVQDEVANHFTDQHIPKASFIKDERSYGFDFENDRMHCWFGMWPEGWQELGSAFLFEVKASPEAMAQEDCLVKKLGFRKHLYDGNESEFDYYRGINLKEGKELNSSKLWASLLNSIEELNSELNPPTRQAKSRNGAKQ